MGDELLMSNQIPVGKFEEKVTYHFSRCILGGKGRFHDLSFLRRGWFNWRLAALLFWFLFQESFSSLDNRGILLWFWCFHMGIFNNSYFRFRFGFVLSSFWFSWSAFFRLLWFLTVILASGCILFLSVWQ